MPKTAQNDRVTKLPLNLTDLNKLDQIVLATLLAELAPKKKSYKLGAVLGSNASPTPYLTSNLIDHLLKEHLIN